MGPLVADDARTSGNFGSTFPANGTVFTWLNVQVSTLIATREEFTGVTSMGDRYAAPNTTDPTRKFSWAPVIGRFHFIHFGFDGRHFVADIGSPEGLAIDWASRNIYWTDSFSDTIEVANLDTKVRRVLFNSSLVNPRGIAVHPSRG
jgi:hypothetical protein